MDGLLPIIRRARRPLLPPDETPQRVVIPVTVDPGPVEAVPLVVVTDEPAAVEAAPAAVPEPATPPARRPRNERKRAQTPPT